MWWHGFQCGIIQHWTHRQKKSRTELNDANTSLGVKASHSHSYAAWQHTVRSSITRRYSLLDISLLEKSGRMQQSTSKSWKLCTKFWYFRTCYRKYDDRIYCLGAADITTPEIRKPLFFWEPSSTLCISKEQLILCSLYKILTVIWVKFPIFVHI